MSASSDKDHPSNGSVLSGVASDGVPPLSSRETYCWSLSFPFCAAV
ncbi:hypothetical protein [Streptomyces avidinii]